MGTKFIKYIEGTPGTIFLGAMEPEQVGVIVESPDTDHKIIGTYIRRTCSTNYFCVENLSDPGIDECWTSKSCTHVVRLLSPGESIVISFDNN